MKKAFTICLAILFCFTLYVPAQAQAQSTIYRGTGNTGTSGRSAAPIFLPKSDDQPAAQPSASNKRQSSASRKKGSSTVRPYAYGTKPEKDLTFAEKMDRLRMANATYYDEPAPSNSSLSRSSGSQGSSVRQRYDREKQEERQRFRIFNFDR